MNLRQSHLVASILLAASLLVPVAGHAQDRGPRGESREQREQREQRDDNASTRNARDGKAARQSRLEQRRQERPESRPRVEATRSQARPRIVEQAAPRRADDRRLDERRQAADRAAPRARERIREVRERDDSRQAALREQRMQDQRRREADHARHQAQLRAMERRQQERLAQEQRARQQRYMRDYQRRVQQQHALWQSQGYRNANAWYGAPASHRYYRDGRYHQVSRQAADLLQQAVDFGYREGRRAGRADSDDGWRPDYRSSYAYEDASYGYNGWYVDRDEYSYYFREGFRRGYDDGYHDRSRYGRRGNDGDYLILAAVLSTILALQQIH